MKFCIINFSGRNNGNCSDIADLIEQTKSDEHDVTRFDVYALKMSPCGGCGYTCFEDSANCPYIDDDVYKVYASICSSDMAYYIVPNYCDYPNAFFFIFNERGQCFFQGKPDKLEQYINIDKRFIVLSNTEKENFRQAFNYHVSESSTNDILFLSAQSFGMNSINGGLMKSNKAKQMVEEFISM